MLTMKSMNSAEAGFQHHELKDRLHQRVIEMLDLNAISAMSHAAVVEQLTKLIEQLLQQESVPLNQRERAQVTQDILHEVLGLGPWNRCWRIIPSTIFWSMDTNRCSSNDSVDWS